MPAHGIPSAATAAEPDSTRSGTRSTPSTDPVGPTSSASSAVVQPEPGPDVEHPVSRVDVEQLDHRVHRARLAVGLAVPDVQRAVVARPAADRPREEPRAGMGRHRGLDAVPAGHVQSARSASAVSTARVKVGYASGMP